MIPKVHERSILALGKPIEMFANWRVGSMSIDNTPMDGFLDCMSVKYGASPYCHFHDTVSWAFSHLRRYPSRSSAHAILVGHGSPGIINCGLGKIFTNNPKKFIGTANISHWRVHASRGIRAKRLILSGCHTGQGVQGARLLNILASSLGIPVSAWTGLVWCSPSATWGEGRMVTASPGAPATPVPWLPFRKIVSATPPIKIMRFALGASGFEDISIDQVSRIQLVSVESSCGELNRLDIEGNEVHGILDLIDFGSPIVTKARPAAIQTGLLKITYLADDSALTRTFRVLGPSIIQDEDFQDVFYSVSPALNQMVYLRDKPNQ